MIRRPNRCKRLQPARRLSATFRTPPNSEPVSWVFPRREALVPRWLRPKRRSQVRGRTPPWRRAGDSPARKDRATRRGPGAGAMSTKHARTLGLQPEDSNPCSAATDRLRRADGEFAVLGRALDGAEADARCRPRYASCSTRARSKSALHLRWEQVHSDRAVLPDFKSARGRSGSRRPHRATPAE